MNDRDLAEALRASDPGAMAASYDHFADDLFQFCWFMLRDRDAARVALRDALIAAQAHIRRLKDPDLLRPWLYALAREECRRRRPAPANDPDVTVARPDQRDAERRLTAWNAVMGLPAVTREALDLEVRRALAPAGIGLVFGVSSRDAQGLLDRGRKRLEHAVIGEILARAAGHECAGRAAILGDRRGTLTVPMRVSLARHASGCSGCSRQVPEHVSVAKVFGVLPVPEPPPGMRLRTMTCFTDPELAGYRSLVAKRADRFNKSGFPIPAPAGAGPQPGSGTPRAGLWVCLVSGAAAVLAGAVFALATVGGLERAVPGAAQSPPGPAAGQPDSSSGRISGRGITPTSPLGTVPRPGARKAEHGNHPFALGGLRAGARGRRGLIGTPGGRPPGAPVPPPGGARPGPTGGHTSPPPTGNPAPTPTPTPIPTQPPGAAASARPSTVGPAPASTATGMPAPARTV